ncbi:conserved hypothetical protein [Nostocoides japonicum T1-X7]|uniref:DUF3037 domain-containing protein n=1 Tax=Nostocoides japonicum T1-X7 TaxID=1194083 RepID=A0A077LUW2_9MICO|nr:DUF3037 domain-containing protein [Tetrasphaera japonica]CCH77688.1 conserved hypothetical protein [Tetrasphaera japonica T1-X7]
MPYQYVVLRCVPRVDREEFVNVGVVLYCQAAGFLATAHRVDGGRLLTLDPDLDVAGVVEALESAQAVCEGREARGLPHLESLGRRFGWLAAPRSTVIQPGPVHSGLTNDPAGALSALLDRYVA